jgi:hypothetical protein
MFYYLMAYFAFSIEKPPDGSQGLNGFLMACP